MHLFFYNFFLFFYKLAVRLVALWNPKAKLWIGGRKGLMERLKTEVGTHNTEEKSKKKEVKSMKYEAGSTSYLLPPASGLVWMHCASLGEFEQGRPVLEAIRLHYPQVKILLTFFSPSGYEVRKNYPGADYIYYLPLDGRSTAREFLDIVQPSMVLWVKYEYWYYYLNELKKRKIPVLLVSGIFRHNQPFFKWFGRLHQYMLECFSHLFVQNNASKELLATIHFTKQVTVSGDTRFDRVTTIAEQFEPLSLVEQFIGNNPVIVAGSTWLEDEEELDHYANTHPELRIIIAPHEVDEERIKEVEALFKHSVRFSQLQHGGNTPGQASRPVRDDKPINTLIIDNIGMLSRLYKYATITYVGGGFGEDGVHNVLEAAVYGKPVVFGPEYDKYVEAVELLVNGGALVIENALELEQVFNELLANKTKYDACCKAAKDYVYTHKGATHTIFKYIQENRLLTN